MKPYKGCVYRATLTRTGKAYIGKTLAGLKARRYVHHWHARNGLKTPFAHALNAYVESAFSWEVLFLSDDDDLLKQVEREQIAFHRECGARLYNLSEGGEGYSGAKWTDERRARQAATIARKRAAGENTMSEKQRQKLSEIAKARTGHTVSDDGKRRISEAKKLYWSQFTPSERRARLAETAKKSAATRLAKRQSES